MIRKITLIFSLATAVWRLGAQSADIQVTTPVTDPVILEAIEYTTSIWEQHLISPVPVKVNFIMFPVSGAFLGFTFPNGRKNFPGAPMEDTWYPSCLANALAGVELNPGESDMDIVMANDVNWYFGTDGDTPSNKFDFVSVLLHEIGHGLGIVSLADSQGGEGSFGVIDFSQFEPFVPTFPIPQLDGLPGIYDRFLVSGTGQALADTAQFSNTSAQLHAVFTGGNIFYDGPEGILANGNQQPEIFAPPAFAFGTSISHLDENSYPVSGGNSLMTPYISPGEVEHQAGPVALGILKDIGWNLVSSVSTPSAEPTLEVKVLGNGQDAVLQVVLQSAGPVEWMLVDGTGQVVFSEVVGELQQGTHFLPFGNLSTGFYVAMVKWSGRGVAEKVVICH